MTHINLSNNFTLEQLTFSETAVRRGLDNTPTPEQEENLRELAQSLERVQQILGSALHINSAFRGPKVNAAIGGASTSAHLEGYAADFTCPGFGTPLEVCKAIAGSEIPFDQIIHEYKSWCHFSIDPRMRKMLLTKNTGEPYEAGLA
jgi:hypothetical protein